MTTQLVESEVRIYDLPMDQILCDDGFNCRGPIPPIDVVDLARSIESNGLQQPITVQPWDKVPGKRYRIVSGHRRWSACRVLKWKVVPSIIKEGLDELTARKLNLEENLKRKDLNLRQEAGALRPFIKAGWTQEEMAAEFHQSRGWIQSRCNLLDMPEEIQQEAAAGFITQEHIRQLRSLKTREEQFEAVRKIKASKMANEKKPIRATPKKKNPLAKRKKEREEIFEMMEMFMGVVGPGFYSRCMAWTAGEISDFEIMRDFRDFVREEHGMEWTIPQEVLKAVNL